MGPQPLAEDNLPKDDGDTSEDELPRIAGGTFVGGMGGDDVGTSDEESDERVEVGGYQLLNTDANARVNWLSWTLFGLREDNMRFRDLVYPCSVRIDPTILPRLLTLGR